MRLPDTREELLRALYDNAERHGLECLTPIWHSAHHPHRFRCP